MLKFPCANYNTKGTKLKQCRISKELIEKAEAKSEEMGKLNNSITKGDGNIAGFIGEFMVAEETGSTVCNTYDYDLISKKNWRIDVKTKRTNFPPKPYYECSIAAYNIKQDCDFYVFTRVKNDLSVGWILGYYAKMKYFKDAVFHREGDIDNDNKFVFKADCYNMKISSLKEI